MQEGGTAKKKAHRSQLDVLSFNGTARDWTERTLGPKIKYSVDTTSPPTHDDGSSILSNHSQSASDKEEHSWYDTVSESDSDSNESYSSYYEEPYSGIVDSESDLEDNVDSESDSEDNEDNDEKQNKELQSRNNDAVTSEKATEIFLGSYDRQQTTNWSNLQQQSNALVDYGRLVHIIETGLVCMICVQQGSKCLSQLQVQRQGRNSIGTNVTIYCSECASREGNDYEPLEASHNKIDEDGVDHFDNDVLNHMSLFLCMRLGIGYSKLSTILGFFGIRPSVGYELPFRNLMVKLHTAIVKVSLVTMADNIRQETVATQQKLGDGCNWKNGRLGLFASWDMGWQRRSSGRAYNSLSGIGFLLGGMTNLIMSLAVFSKLCVTCDVDVRLGRTKTPHWCPKNHYKSSRGMEALGGLQCVLDVYKQNDGAYICGICTDDDAPTCAILRHSYKATLPRCEWPLTKKGNYKSDPGQMPLHMPIVDYLYCDKAHRRKAYGSALYALIAGDDQLKSVDCERFKRNFGLCLVQQTSGAEGASFEKFEKAMKAVLEHQFNNHAFCCATWCKFMTENDEQLADIDTKKRFLDKTKGKTYESVSKVHERLTTDEKLRQCYHEFSSQKNEMLNKKMSVTAPKDQTFCGSVQLDARTHFVGLRDSLGELASVARVMKELELDRLPRVTRECLLRDDNLNAYHTQRRLLPAVKLKRAAKKREKLIDEMRKLEKDRKKKLLYKSGVMLETELGEGGLTRTNKRRSATGPTAPCKCGSSTHQRTTSKLCPLRVLRPPVAPKKAVVKVVKLCDMPK